MASSLPLQTLGFPARFHLAVKFAEEKKIGEGKDDMKLLLYALEQQATFGPNTTAKPSMWNRVAKAKWDCWSHLGNISKLEAMWMYVRTVESEQPKWLEDPFVVPLAQEELLKAEQEAAEAMKDKQEKKERSTTTTPTSSDQNANVSSTVTGQNSTQAAAAAEEGPVHGGGAAARPPSLDATSASAFSQSARSLLPLQSPGSTCGTEDLPLASGEDSAPRARYKHSASVVSNGVIVFGGGGPRLCRDVHRFDTSSYTWKRVATENPPSARMGHSAIVDGERILVLGGYGSKGDLSVCHMLNTTTLVWTQQPTTGSIPKARGGHACVHVGRRLFVFGGEANDGRLLNDLAALDTQTWKWEEQLVSGHIPPARTDALLALMRHSYAKEEDHLVLYGGSAVTLCHDDIHVFQILTRVWSKIQCNGPLPGPRAGHAGVVIDNCLCVFGGGNGRQALNDFHVFNPVTFQWTTRKTIKMSESGGEGGGEGEPVQCGSEGLSMSNIGGGRLFIFGGYNGKYSNHACILHIGPNPNTASPVVVGEIDAERLELLKPLDPPPAPTQAAFCPQSQQVVECHEDNAPSQTLIWQQRIAMLQAELESERSQKLMLQRQLDEKSKAASAGRKSWWSFW